MLQTAEEQCVFTVMCKGARSMCLLYVLKLHLCIIVCSTLGRAVDNQVYVATASPARDESASYISWGHSTVVNPWWVSPPPPKKEK